MVKASWPYCPRRLLRYVLLVASFALVVAVAGGFIGQAFIPDAWVEIYNPPEEGQQMFRWVMGEHYGLYLGAITGCISWLMRIRSGGVRAATQ